MRGANLNKIIESKRKITKMFPIEVSYPLSAYILLPIATIYMGIFLNISNHYILRPKVIPFIEKLSISSPLAIEILMDIISNLSFITYSACSFFTNPVTDGSFRIVSLYSIYWLTLCMAGVMYFKVPNDPNISTIIICKNGLLLVLGFVNVAYHYFADQKFITLPTILIGLYALNVLITAYEDKFMSFVFELLSIKEPEPPKPKKKMISHLPTIEQLSVAYPLPASEIEEKMSTLSTRHLKTNQKDNRNMKNPLLTKIETKILASDKLMKICVAVHLSMMKKHEDEKNAVRYFYAMMNGTLPENMPAMRKSRKGTDKSKGKANNKFLDKRNQDKLKATARQRDSAVSSLSQGPRQELLQQNIPESTQMKLYGADSNFSSNELTKNVENIENESLLFYIFPVRFLESSKIISLIFSLIINLGFGVLLSYCQIVMGTVNYGRFTEFVLAALFIPSIPNTSPFEFLNTLILATIWKLNMCGLFALLSILINVNSNGDMTSIAWNFTSYLGYVYILGLALLILAFIFVLGAYNKWKVFILFFLFAASAAGFCFYVGI